MKIGRRGFLGGVLSFVAVPLPKIKLPTLRQTIFHMHPAQKKFYESMILTESRIVAANVPRLFEREDTFYSWIKTASSPSILRATEANERTIRTMPAKLTLTAQDLKRGTIIEEATWYPILITAVKEEVNKAQDAKNVVVDAELLPSSDPAKNKYAGVPVRRYFSEKAPGMAKNYIAACGVTIPEEGGEFDLEGSVGRQMEAFIKTRLDDNGRMQNDVVDFRPPSKS